MEWRKSDVVDKRPLEKWRSVTWMNSLHVAVNELTSNILIKLILHYSLVGSMGLLKLQEKGQTISAEAILKKIRGTLSIVRCCKESS